MAKSKKKIKKEEEEASWCPDRSSEQDDGESMHRLNKQLVTAVFTAEALKPKVRPHDGRRQQ